MADESEIMQAMMYGINFGGKKRMEENPDKIKTKARKKTYHTGAHHSGAARHKAEIRQRVKNRASQRKKK